jgi:hypothetical protein
VLREDNGAIVCAASQASKAADFLLGFLPGDDAEHPRPSAREHDYFGSTRGVWRVRQVTNWSLPRVGRFFANRDHLTVVHS